MFGWIEKLRAPRAERKLMAWHAPGRAVWPMRDAAAFAREGYAQNAVAYRCVRLIAEAAASAPLKVGPPDHPLARLLARPNPEQTGIELLESFFGHLQVSGNAYLEAASLDGEAPSELYALRPDRMSVVPGADGWPIGWEHRVGAQVRRFERDPLSGQAPILHLKLFHPSDARPHPAFPARADVWADGPNWRLGHWINGRAGLSGLGEVVAALCARTALADVDVAGLRGVVNGYVVDSPASARDALEPLMAAFDLAAAERDGRIVFFHRDAATPASLARDDLAAESAAALIAERADSAVLPIEARVRFIDPTRDYLAAAVSARRLDRAEGGVVTVDAPLVLEADAAERLAQAVLAEHRAGAEALALSLGPALLRLEPGDHVAFEAGVFEIVRAESAETSRLELRRARVSAAAHLGLADPNAPPAIEVAPTPVLALLDLPPLPGAEEDERPLAAVFASPWLGAHVIYAGAEETLRAVAQQPACVGELLWALWPGPVDRWDEGNLIRVKLYGGALASVSRTALLNGANAFAIETENGEWEIVQARDCVLTAPGEYELSGFLRGRLGSAHAMAAPHPVGARIVALDQRLARLNVHAHEWGEDLHVAAPPFGALANDPRAAAQAPAFPHAALRPWAPAHLRARRTAGDDVVVSWIRCARTGGDSWGPGEPPLGAPAESYRLEVLNGGDVVRTVEIAAPNWIYPATNQVTDFGGLPAALTLSVAQMNAAGRPGLNTELTITL